jgi:AcrR family transcriptional regulator
MRVRDEHKESLIREKAIEMIVKKGLDGLSMQKLAKAAGCSPATIYIYFKDRDDLIVQLFLGEFTRMTESALLHFDPAMSFAEGLKVQWINRAEFYMENPGTMDFLEQLRHSPHYERVYQLMDRRFFEAMGNFVHTAIQRKELIPLSTELYWSIAFAPLYQLLKFHIGKKAFGGKKEKFVLTEEIMMKALGLVIKALTP